MKTSARFFISVLMIIPLVFLNCEKDDKDENDGYSIEVITYKGAFEGYYKVDDNNASFFESTVSEENANYHTFSQKIDPDSSVYICATAVDTSASSMQIFLYYDGKILDTASFSQSTDSNGDKSTVSGTLQYTIETTETTSSSKSPARNTSSLASGQRASKGKLLKDRNSLFFGFAPEYESNPFIPQDLSLDMKPHLTEF